MKTEKPTPHRLLKESRKGKSYNSKDLTATAVMVGGLIALAGMTSTQPLATLFKKTVLAGVSADQAGVAWSVAWAVLAMALPAAAGCIVAAVGVSLLQSRGVIAVEAIKIDFNKLNPVNGFKNLFSLKVIKALVAALLYLLMGALFITLAWRLMAPGIFMQVHTPVTSAGSVWMQETRQMLVLLLSMMAPVALAAAFVEYVLFIREMRMDKSEIKQEHKEHDGNPEVKQKRREINNELSAQVQADVKNSSMILANPTHVAVGIYMHADYPGLQFVSVRESEARARAVIALAEQEGIPVIRDIPLAREVYATCRRYTFVDVSLVARITRLFAWLRDVEAARHLADEEEDDTGSAHQR